MNGRLALLFHLYHGQDIQRVINSGDRDGYERLLFEFMKKQS